MAFSERCVVTILGSQTRCRLSFLFYTRHNGLHLGFNRADLKQLLREAQIKLVNLLLGHSHVIFMIQLPSIIEAETVPLRQRPFGSTNPI